MYDIIYFVLICVFLLSGLVGVLFPILPGVPFMFLTVMVYTFIDHFNHITAFNLVIFLVITIMSILVDYLAGFWGAKFFGATRIGALGAFIGSLVGLFFFPPFGIFIGLIAGVLIAEIIFNKSSIKKSSRAATGALLGSLAGIGINFLLGLIFVSLFIYFFWK